MKRLLNSRNKKDYSMPLLVSHIAIAVLSGLILIAVTQWDIGSLIGEFHEGDIALRDIYAPYDFNIDGEIDTKATESAKRKAMDIVLPIYVFDLEMHNVISKEIDTIFNSLISLREAGNTTEEERRMKIKELALSFNVEEEVLQGILEFRNIERFSDYIEEILRRFSDVIVISESDYIGKDTTIKAVRVVNKSNNSEIIKPVEDIRTLETLKKDVEYSASIIAKDKKERKLIIDFLNIVLPVNTIYDKEKTFLEKESADESTPIVYNKIEVKKNELLVSKGERIGKPHLAKLIAIERDKLFAARVGGIIAVSIFVCLFMIIMALYFKFYEPLLLSGNKELLLFAVICISFIVSAKLIVISPWPRVFIPVSVASMLIALLISGRLSIVATCFLSILTGMISGNILDIAGLSLVGGMIGIFAVSGVRRRWQLISAGFSIGFANMSYLVGIGLIRALDLKTYLTECFLGFSNGVGSAIIVTGLLPIFENLFKITTDISLLELADLNHPLLKKMIIEAPGTYHHSLVVGNLAEAACESIGANSLLARVGSYFHDIGKIEKAGYFSENETNRDSAHDKLSPTMSSLIITNHVKNGVELAQKYRLNEKIIDIIKQHHGTGIVFYFFKRALEKGQEEDIGEQSFRYPGPKPQTKEAACVLLADSVEASSRALDDPTPSRIKGLVRKIVNNKFIDGQLDECDLTLKDLEKIAEIFTHILTGIFHTRVEYPEEKTIDG